MKRRSDLCSERAAIDLARATVESAARSHALMADALKASAEAVKSYAEAVSILRDTLKDEQDKCGFDVNQEDGAHGQSTR